MTHLRFGWLALAAVMGLSACVNAPADAPTHLPATPTPRLAPSLTPTTPVTATPAPIGTPAPTATDLPPFLFTPEPTAPTALLIPMGGGYSDVYAGFSAAAVQRARANTVTILVLAMTYTSHPQSITEAERAVNLRDANERRFQIEEACKRAAPANVTCRAVLIPVFTRPEALAWQAADLDPAEVSAVFVLGGDQGVAMRVLANTPLEAFLSTAYAQGAAVGGTSAGGGLQARAMIADYNPNFARANALAPGAVQVWTGPTERGLLFGLQAATLDQHFFQRGRVGRLLNALTLPDVPDVGIGVDAYTGVNIVGGARLEQVFGLYTVGVFDAATFNAAPNARVVNNTLSMRHVLVHLLAPGAFHYDLTTRAHSLAAPPALPDRTFEALTLPPGAGPLLLGGDVSASPANPVWAEFARRVGRDPVTVVAVGYPSASSARTAAQKYLTALGATGETRLVSTGDSTPLTLPETGAVIVIARDVTNVDVAALAGLKQAWLAGRPLWADGPAAALLGQTYAAHGPTPREGEEAELATQKSFINGRTTLKPGLGLLAANVEPALLNDNRWGRAFSLAYHHPETVVVGPGAGAVLALTAQGASIWGDNAVFILDARQSARALGDNQGYVIANLFLDVFAPGDTLGR